MNIVPLTGRVFPLEYPQRYFSMRTVIAALVLLATSIVPAAADLEQAKSDYENGLYEAAYRAFEPLAGGGDAEAQYYLGRMYEWGQFVDRNPEMTDAWYQKAADQGHCEATVALYDFLFGRARSTKDAGEFFRSPDRARAFDLRRAAPRSCAQAKLRYLWGNFPYVHTRPLPWGRDGPLEDSTIELYAKDSEFAGKSEAELRTVYKKAYSLIKASIGAMIIVSTMKDDPFATQRYDFYMAIMYPHERRRARQAAESWAKKNE